MLYVDVTDVNVKVGQEYAYNVREKSRFVTDFR